MIVATPGFSATTKTPITIDSMARQFGKVPIQMRQWVRHIIDVPADNGSAFEWDGTVTFVNPADDMLPVIIHETGHSLDLSGAYADNTMSDSDNWWNNYDQDSNVPDNYAQTNAREDVAQNIVNAVFNENVYGGYGSMHQFETLIDEAATAGQGNSPFKPGENVQCTHRLPPSAPVSTDGSSKTRRARRGMPSVGLSDKVIALSTSREGDDKHSRCGLHW
ncbi:hypothetical protein BDV96DRAFT_690507 [Lophiotrema nucula]|uniref:Uncharacterized protein n=1 Tax=Lophiotrema nucula TaxID=690887 RepID=A0A6A5YW38_9PLEO|nr:hypothetical protein BDV96DRAFT_690507 [Lophiotrema nucula]